MHNAVSLWTRQWGEGGELRGNKLALSLGPFPAFQCCKLGMGLGTRLDTVSFVDYLGEEEKKKGNLES